MVRPGNLAIVVSMTLLMGGCSNSGARYCEAEGRKLTEIEWKSRALVERNLRLRSANLSKRSRLVDQQYTIREAESYIRAHPDCCEVDYGDRFNLVEGNLEVKDANFKGGAAFYILGERGIGTPAFLDGCADDLIFLSQG